VELLPVGGGHRAKERKARERNHRCQRSLAAVLIAVAQAGWRTLAAVRRRGWPGSHPGDAGGEVHLCHLNG
jgi:hypothetical protein